MVALAKTKKDLGNLLKYTGELLSINEKIVFDIAGESFSVFPEHAVSGLEGVDLAIDDETWIKIRRLRESAPPDCDPMFQVWADFGKHASPDNPPKLHSERMIRLSAEEVSELAEAELLSSLKDVMRPVEDDTSDYDVILRTSGMPEFTALWKAYLDGPWQSWAKVERPRRRSIDFYNKIYQIHQRIVSMGDDTPIELVFGLGIARWRLGDDRLNIPLIEQLIEVRLEDDGTLVIGPRQSSPQLVLRPFHALEVEGSKGVQKNQAAQFERIVEDPDRGFSPFDKSTYESVLRACAAGLSPTGIYHPDELSDPNDRTVPTASDTLRISDTWAVFVRTRNEDFRKEDIRRIIEELDDVESEEELPAPGIRFVEEPSDAVPTHDDSSPFDLTGTSLRLPEQTAGWQGGFGGSSSGSGGQPKQSEETYFFPLPFNDEQIQVIRRLEEKGSKGVLVQGPPGTGKTHTIANVICHYLATNRRVLVTAKTPEALTALQDKIPAGIRDLTIAVIHNDREGARQLEHAVRILADEAKSINPRYVADQIQEKQARIIEHVRSPMEQGKIIKPDDVLAGCDSGFERNFGRCLLELGYRLRAQVPVAGRFIDFVVEGADDRRLAIELDGDKYHGPDRWAEDICRQKALERLGWTFWRCWGSSWISDRQGCLDDLRATMARMGIEPLGMAANDDVYTLHIVVPHPDAVQPEEDRATSHGAPRSEPVSANESVAATTEPVLDQVLGGTPAPEPAFQAAPAVEAEQPSNDLELGDEIEVGDLVVIRYDDTPDRPIRFRLSKTENRPSEGIVHVQEPLGVAVLGASVDDAIKVSIGGRSRTAVIEQIEKRERQVRRPSFDDSPVQRPILVTTTAHTPIGTQTISAPASAAPLPLSGSRGHDFGDGVDLGQETREPDIHGNGRSHHQSDRYQEVDLVQAGFVPNSALIDEKSYEDTLVSMIRHIVEIEGPIHEDLLAHRIAIDGHKFKRTGRAMKANVVRLARHFLQSTEEDVGLFFWPNGVTHEEWTLFRQPDGNTEPRSINEISEQELRALVLMAQKIAGRREDPWKVMARLAGVQRLRAPSRERIRQASGGLINADEEDETEDIELSTGCNLGEGAVLEQDEQIFCHLHRRDPDSKPDGVAVARDGGLYVKGERVQPQRRNAWLQAALRVVQQDAGDLSERTGETKSLNAWLCWYVRRDGVWTRLADLRTQVSKRNQGDRSGDQRELSLENLDL